MKEVISVSLGSSRRDHEVQVKLMGEEFKIKRVGTDGDLKRTIALLRELDGKVDAFGLGGIDLHLYAPGGKRYAIRDAMKLKRAVDKTPIVDGSGLKNTLEREVINYLQDGSEVDFKDKTVLMVSAVDRFGMADAFYNAGCKMIFGDLIFGLKIPVPLRSMTSFRILARLILPVVTKMPFKMLYPTGEKQEREPKEKYSKYYHEADIIAGDFLFIKKHMPKDMKGKIVLTNTVTTEDVEDLRRRGVKLLITTTPEFEGRSFGTNVMEATLLAVMKKPADEVTPQDYLDMLKKLDFKPRIEQLN